MPQTALEWRIMPGEDAHLEAQYEDQHGYPEEDFDADGQFDEDEDE